MKRVLFDTNVLLDVLLERQPHVAGSAAALDLVTTGAVEGYVAGHAVTTLAYLLQRQVGRAKSRDLLTRLLTLLHVAPITDATVRDALIAEFADFEDAVCHAAALEAHCEVIVTRNVSDFRLSAIPAVIPDVFVASGREVGSF